MRRSFTNPEDLSTRTDVVEIAVQPSNHRQKRTNTRNRTRGTCCNPMSGPASVRWPRQRGERERGAFAALELVILVPFVIVMLLLVVAFGRVSRSRQLVDQAAQAAARAASLSATPGQATTAARTAAQGALRDAGLSCTSMTVTVDTAQFRPGGRVVARVQCRADLSRLAMAGVPGSITLATSATSPLETYRQLAATGSDE